MIGETTGTNAIVVFSLVTAVRFSVSRVCQQRANRNREQGHGDRNDYGFGLHGAL